MIPSSRIKAPVENSHDGKSHGKSRSRSRSRSHGH